MESVGRRRHGWETVGAVFLTLYSKDIITKPTFGFGKPYNDYGLGFYCTDDMDLAKEWGVDFNRNGYANEYEMDCTGLIVLDLNAGTYMLLHWIAILLENRSFDVPSPLAAEAKAYLLNHFMVNYQACDVIVGYRADNSYFSFAQDFINGAISYRQLSNAMHLGNLGQQFVLKSEKAYDKIRYIGCEAANNDEWFLKKQLRDQSARREYLDVERNRRQRGDLYIAQIMDEEMKADDARLRQTLS